MKNMFDNDFRELMAEAISVLNEQNDYVAFWNKEKIQIKANTSYEAQQKAVDIFQKKTRKKVKGYDISIVLDNGKNLVS